MPQVEGRQIDPGAHLGIRRVDELEAAVEEHAVEAVGADPAADRVGGLEHHDVETRRAQQPGRRQPGKPGPDDHDVGRPGHGDANPAGPGSWPWAGW